MRTKALLAGAGPSFVGPWVNLEKGKWLVVHQPFIGFEVEYSDCTVRHEDPFGDGGDETTFVDAKKIRLFVFSQYEGDGAFVQARQVE